MISRGNDNFIVRHYDRIVAGVALLAVLLAGGFFVLSTGSDGDAAAKEAVAAIDRLKPSANGVEKTDLEPFALALRQTKTPAQLAEIDVSRGNMLASERRVRCRCGNVMPAGLERCPACNASLVIVNEVDEEAKRVGRWKTRYGVECDGNDKDGDGFTNEEEYNAKTDPTDAKDHPEYADSLKLILPLKETYVPFVLTKATQIPNGWRCEFFDPKRKDNYGRLGRSFTTVVGQEICVPVGGSTGVTKDEPTGYVLKGFEKKEELRAITAGSSMKKSVDVSVATVTRKTDGKNVELVIQSSSKKVRLAPIDVQATLVYERGGSRNLAVVAGEEFDLNGTTYRVASVKTIGKGAEVVVENKSTGKRKTLKALE